MAQPVDIGTGRPLTLRIRELWVKFVMEQGLTQPSSGPQIERQLQNG